MSKPELLDNVTHHDVRVITRYDASYGHGVNQTLVFPTEFSELQREYAIFFRRTAAGSFHSVALLGLDSGENLFLHDGVWDARYIPALHQRGPCLLGFREVGTDGQTVREPVIMIDMDDPRVNRSEGVRLFLPAGGKSSQLDRMSRALRTLQQGMEASEAMFAAFNAAGLLTRVKIDLRLDDSRIYTLPDLFTINAEALSALSAEKLASLNAKGFLALAFMVITSVSNVNWLMEMKNISLERQARLSRATA